MCVSYAAESKFVCLSNTDIGRMCLIGLTKFRDKVSGKCFTLFECES